MTTIDTNPIVLLEHFGLVNSLPCGGKARGLSRLIFEGAMVPSGICVIRSANEPSTSTAITAWLNENAAGNAKAKYAVRSSATCEDGHRYSFAGMFSTLLDVDRENVLAAVHQCQNSGENQRSQGYGGGSLLRPVKIAVVIQEMITPLAAGVCFTVNPLTNNTDELVIEVVKGPGEKLVGGAITPEFWLVDKCNVIIEMQLGEETSTGETILQVPKVQELATEARRLARKFGFPLDIEFAFAGPKLFLLQARPVTTLQVAA